MAVETAVLLNISEMIDLAIGTPEVGVVDFGMLQTVLHCLAQQQRVLGKNVELRGSVAALPVGRENLQTIAVSEYLVDTDVDKISEKKLETTPTVSGVGEQETILVVERVKKADSPVTRSPTRATSPPPKTPTAPPSQPSQLPPSAGLSSKDKLSLVTLSKFNLLENAVDDLKNRVYGSLPKNEEILEEVRSQTNLKAITDMWTSLNVSSRLEAAEAGISKLSSLIQDLIAETTGLQNTLQRRASKTLSPEMPVAAVGPAPPSTPIPIPTQDASGQPPTAAETAIQQTPQDEKREEKTPSPPTGPTQAFNTKDELAAIHTHLARLRADLDQLTKTFYATMEEMQAGIDAIPPSPQSQPLPADTTTSPATAAPAAVTPTTDKERRRSEFQRPSFSAMTSGLVERINELEKRLKECCDNMSKNDGVMKDQLNSFQDQLEYVLKQLSSFTQDSSLGKLSPDLIKDLKGLMKLFQTVQEMQDHLKQVHDTALQLAAEKEDRQHNMNALLEQIELLKTIKLDREDMEEAMADKADLRLLARKVSHDQFELACDDLSRGLEHALGKLNMQESLWQQALDDIQREIETKLDKIELSPVKDFFNNRLRQLQDNLKQMALLRREAEAAGTKKRLLRDVKCISCDANAVMAMEATAVSTSRPLPATLSMKPYLSYELDTIRKSQATNLPQRNMHDWETIEKQMSQVKQPPKARSETDKHLCNRYCGGSHTVTTPAQRVARTGHFVKQWGPEVLPLSSGLAAGDDGRMYKVNTVENANVGPDGAVDASCTPKPPAKKSEPIRTPQKPVAGPECRCLENDRPAK